MLCNRTESEARILGYCCTGDLCSRCHRYYLQGGVPTLISAEASFPKCKDGDRQSLFYGDQKLRPTLPLTRVPCMQLF